MEKTEKVHDHLDSAKEELKSAATSLVKETKDKAKEVVGSVAASIADAADKVHADATKAVIVNKTK